MKGRRAPTGEAGASRRVSCPEHGVHVASVPWAKPGSRFTTDVAYSAAWMLKGGLSKKRYDGLVNIGIDETSYRKGHKYVTTVVNHDTNTVVWAHEGYGKTEEQRASIRLVSGDGARYITDAVAKFCPNATRCFDPFHVVEWANDALGSIRIDRLAPRPRDDRRDGAGSQGLGEPRRQGRDGEDQAGEEGRGGAQGLEVRPRQEPREPHAEAG